MPNSRQPASATASSFQLPDASDQATGLQIVMPPFCRELTISGHITDLPDVLAFIEVACEEAGVYPELWFDLQLAVEEACANVIEHAYSSKGGDLVITFAARGRDVVLTVRDHGRPFAPEKVIAPDMSLPLTQRSIGGLGLHLMYQLMDEVQFDFAEGSNTLVMVKRDALASLPVEAADSAVEGE
jgi:serine/threonine-protein kinase RsbW